jgi:DNA-binding response OmpR family regulator
MVGRDRPNTAQGASLSAGPVRPAVAKRHRILVADDDPTIAAMLRRYLEREFDVDVAVDGPSAIALASKLPSPDLLLLDVMMPGLDGLGVAQRVRMLPQLARVPIIFLTAKTQPQDLIRGIQAGARHYVAKPFKLEDLLLKIRKSLP